MKIYIKKFVYNLSIDKIGLISKPATLLVGVKFEKLSK